MSKIDWSKAPDWADGHGLVAHHGITEVWINMDQYAVVGAEDRAYPYGGGTGDNRHNFTQGQIQYITPRPAHWAGEGSPPVGTTCEWHPSSDQVIVVTILGRDGDETWFRRKGAEDSETCLRMAFFSPIRTPEQIAEAERRESIATLVQHICADGAFDVDDPEVAAAAAKIYDAGYRKQVAP
ncbi:hypothetical protein ACF8R6_02935 [Pseudomonas sp. CJQ_7]|uniref:hypothetical protein n=1 Tax=Pseudomonas sp. CJQ_7 TaxID=3367166 RepID=UPI00370C0A75